MTETPTEPRNPPALKRVIIHPELHRLFQHERADSGETIQDLVHRHLCEATGRTDLLGSPVVPEPSPDAEPAAARG